MCNERESWPSLVAAAVKRLPAARETGLQSLGWEDPLEKGVATHPVFWPGESMHRPGGLQSMGLQGTVHDCVADSHSRPWELWCLGRTPSLKASPVFLLQKDVG